MILSTDHGNLSILDKKNYWIVSDSQDQFLLRQCYFNWSVTSMSSVVF